MLSGTPNVLENCNNSNIAMAQDRWCCGGLNTSSAIYWLITAITQKLLTGSTFTPIADTSHSVQHNVKKWSGLSHSPRKGSPPHREAQKIVKLEMEEKIVEEKKQCCTDNELLNCIFVPRNLRIPKTLMGNTATLHKSCMGNPMKEWQATIVSIWVQL